MGGGGGHVKVTVLRDTVIGCPTVVDNADMPETMVWVAPPLEDNHANVSYFAAGCVEEYLTSGVA